MSTPAAQFKQDARRSPATCAIARSSRRRWANTRSRATSARRPSRIGRARGRSAAETQVGGGQPSRPHLEAVRFEARGARHQSPLGQHRRSRRATSSSESCARRSARVDHQVQGDDLRGDPPQRGDGDRPATGGRVRPGRVHRPAPQGGAVSHRVPGDAPDAR